jgi:hypothetical protein
MLSRTLALHPPELPLLFLFCSGEVQQLLLLLGLLKRLLLLRQHNELVGGVDHALPSLHDLTANGSASTCGKGFLVHPAPRCVVEKVG